MPPKQSLTSNGKKEGDEKEAKNRIKCLYCENTYSTSGNLTVHVEKKHKAVAIKCKTGKCSDYFHTEEERKKHKEDVHDKARERLTHPCIICGKKYGRYRDCLKHVKEKHEKNVFKCSFYRCYTYFLNEQELETHLESQHKKDQEHKIFKCKKCDYKTGDLSNFKRHGNTMHGKDSLECDNCKKKYASKYSLERHIKRSYIILKKCRFCTQNVPRIHEHSKKKQCKRCKTEFLCSGLLANHQSDRKDCKPPLHKCTNCLKAFPFKCLLQRHTKSKTCQTLKSNIEQEMQEATEEKQSKRDGSTVQPKTQEETSNLIHCAHCPESFPRFNALKRHLFSKHSLIDGRFECEPCQKKFLFLKNLIQHFRVAHMKTD